MRFVFPIVTLLLAGCTPLQWVRSDAVPKQVEEDLGACRLHAWREVRMHAPMLHRPLPYAVQDAQGRRFLVWPQAGFYDSFGDQFMEESRLAHFCMRSKGYELVPVEKDKAATLK